MNTHQTRKMPLSSQKETFHVAHQCFRAAIAYLQDCGDSVEAIRSEIVDLIVSGFVSTPSMRLCSILSLFTWKECLCYRISRLY
jgi:hypothetical protein